MKIALKILSLALAGCLLACCTGKPTTSRQLDIILYADFPSSRATLWQKELKKIFVDANIIKTQVPMPIEANYLPRNRYLANKILDCMSAKTPEGHLTLGMTTSDISIPYKNHTNWGIMGLSYCPGNVSIISTYRLKDNKADNQGLKLCLHELGHAEGLPHCKNTSCFMRDANGKNHFDEMTDFCPSCKKFLQNKGWKLKPLLK